MNEIELTYEQNLRAAIVFINMFGLLVEEKEDLCQGDTLKIMTSDGMAVGNIALNKEKINITAQTELGPLNASYKKVTASTFIDEEQDHPGAFASWCTKIGYTISRSDEEKIEGLFICPCTMDTEFGINCACGHKLDCFVNANKTMSLKVGVDFSLFEADIFNGDLHESIQILPNDDINGYIKYQIKQGVYGENGFPYQKYSGILPDSNDQEQLLCALTMTSRYKERVVEQQTYKKIGHEKKYEINSKETIIQMGTIMQSLNPDMYEKIQEIKNCLTVGKTSLLDSFITTSLGDYDDAEINALLGIERKPMERNSGKTLVQTYFGNKLFRLTEKK